MQRRVGWLLIPFGWALACGGRFERATQDDDGDVGGTSTGQGGSVQSKAGTGTSGGVTGRAGTNGRGGKKSTGAAGMPGVGGVVSVGGTATGTGGAVSTAGTFAAGGGCACDPIACAPGYLAIPNPNGCCYHCELDVKTCAVQRASYLAFRDQLLQKYGASQCSTDTDCNTYYEKNSCGVSCGAHVAASVVSNLDATLNAYAQMVCNPACAAAPILPCEPLPPAECWKGYCE